MKQKIVLAELEGVQFNINAGYEYAIDEIEGKPFYEYVFTPYAAFKNKLFQQCEEHSQIGTDETQALQFERKELRIKLLQKIRAGHEPDGDSFIMYGLKTPNSATVFNTNTLFWKMASDVVESDVSKPSWKDFPSLFEKVFCLGREEAWLFAWALVRAAYAGHWQNIDALLDHAHMLSTAKGKKREEAKAVFIDCLNRHIFWLKTEVVL